MKGGIFMAALKKATLFLLVFSFLCATSVFADEASIREEINQLKARITNLEQKLGTQEKCMNDQKQCILDQNKKITEYETKLSKFEVNLHEIPAAPMKLMEGLELGVGATMIVQGANNVNNASDGQALKKSRADGSYSTDITFSKEFKEIDSKAFLHLENGQGNGLEDNLILYSNVNRDTDDHSDIRPTEVWYEQGLFKDKAVVTFGKLDPTAYFDTNEVANQETTQFLGRIFRNSPAIEFPDNTAGIRFAYQPKEWIELGYGMFNGNSGTWDKMFDNLFNVGQATFKTNFFNLPGNYRFYGWNSNVYHTKWLDSEKQKEGAYGFGLSFDQKLNDIVTAFLRYGWQDPKVYNPNLTTTAGCLPYSLAQSWSTGLQVGGKPWGREKDVLAFAVGQVIPSNDYKKENTTRLAKTEGHLEAYYKIYVNDHLAISPDFQYIWNPFGKDIADDTAPVFVGGMRAQVDF
jgi:uncharacterized coiled-coil protein SlyX